MTNKEILEKAIQKAIEGGWRPFTDREFKNVVVEHWEEGGMIEVALIDSDIIGAHLQWVRELEGIIFNHDFARALWKKPNEPDYFDIRGSMSGRKGHGSTDVMSKVTDERWVFGWQYHLQQMVIADDPIKYLGEHL